MVRIDPAHHHHHLPLRIDPGNRAAGADCEKTGRGRAGEYAAFEIQPDQIAVKRRQRAGRAHSAHPLGRNNLPPLVPAFVQQQLADARLVQAVDRNAAAPMTAAGNRLHPAAVQIDPGIVVADPAPIAACAQGAHDLGIEHPRQRAAE